MNCPTCNGALQVSANGAYARCPACDRVYMTYGGTLRDVQIPPGMDRALFLQGIGLGAPLPPDPMTATANALKERAANVGVRANVGGVVVDVNRGGVSVDTEKLAKDVEKKVERTVSGWIWGCVFTLVFTGLVGAVLVFVAAIVIWGFASSGGGGSTEEAAWDGKSTWTCPGGKVRIADVRAELPGTAIVAGGNCDLTLDDVDVTAATGIDASGNAKITISGGRIKGSKNAITASANAKVTVEGATIEGPTKTSANGKIEGI